MTNTTAQILNQRQQTYGDFKDVAKIAQQFKHIINSNAGELSAQQQEALEMICCKMARILSGDPNYQDSWQDIAGYALLGGDIKQ